MNLGLVITEKHTKLRGFACPQAKRKERREEREEEEIRMLWGMRGGKRLFIEWGEENFENKREI